jgi:hypothetical protein
MTRCDICDVKKDRENDFYKSNKRTCKDCVRTRNMNRKKEVKSTTLSILEEILENQRVIMGSQERIEEQLSKVDEIKSNIGELNSDIERITRRLKRLST